MHKDQKQSDLLKTLVIAIMMSIPCHLALSGVREVQTAGKLRSSLHLADLEAKRALSRKLLATAHQERKEVKPRPIYTWFARQLARGV